MSLGAYQTLIRMYALRNQYPKSKPRLKGSMPSIKMSQDAVKSYLLVYTLTNEDQAEPIQTG